MRKDKEKIVTAKLRGVADEKIGKSFGVTLREIERAVIEYCGVNLSKFEKRKIKTIEPKDFRLENSTVWSFKSRGSWATHSGRYRGNWSPYMPRNLILRYSKPGDIILDQFVGGGTTAIEAKLLGRRCIAYDINPQAVALTLENLSFSVSKNIFYKIYEPQVRVGDARQLELEDKSIDAIFTHPPYAGIVKYSSKVEGDLSSFSIPDYLNEMEKVAKESYSVLKKGGVCAILIGDLRKNKRVVPLGFKVIDIFLNVGFKLREIVIKAQHNCKTTGLWYKKSIERNFLLLQHEYLAIFEKSNIDEVQERAKDSAFEVEYPGALKSLDKLETTTIWLFPQSRIFQDAFSNLSARYSVELRVGENLFFVRDEKDEEALKRTLEGGINHKDGWLFVLTKDMRYGRYLYSPAKNIATRDYKGLALREIIVVAPENFRREEHREELEIVHFYILVFEVLK